LWKLICMNPSYAPDSPPESSVNMIYRQNTSHFCWKVTTKMIFLIKTGTENKATLPVTKINFKNYGDFWQCKEKF